MKITIKKHARTIPTILLIATGILLSSTVYAKDENEKKYVTQVELQAAIEAVELTPGPEGAKGDVGAKGDAGVAGAKGDTGDIGATGSTGAKGDTGEVGAIGQTGATGQNGADGVMYDGVLPGDMQYWNGNAWIMITAPAEDADSLSFCDGQPTWTQGGCNVYEIGDTGPAGGIVFYVSNQGKNGLEAAPVDQGVAQWGCQGADIKGTFTAIGNGLFNTESILNQCGDSGIAASLAFDYVLNGYTDWFLPSLDELNFMYKGLGGNNLGGFVGDYWSSSQSSVQEAWAATLLEYCADEFGLTISCNSGTFSVIRSNVLFVRAVREF
jgi:hypothetical protein